ncbi:MAG: ABC transporter permease [Gemmataceae bacterium]
MRATTSLIRREFSAYFLSPVAYVVLAIFLFTTGYLFHLTLQQLTARGPHGIEYPMQLLLGSQSYVAGRLEDWRYLVGFLTFWLVFLSIPPLLTMRLFAEERSTGTLEMLMTAPLRDWQVVLSKYLACYAFYLVLWLPTLLYVPALIGWNWSERTAGIDPFPVLTSYLGIALAGGMFLALGLLVSSLVKSQLVAFLVSLFLSMGFVIVGFWQSMLSEDQLLGRLMAYFSVPAHFDRDFSRGIIDTGHLVLYVSVALFCLFLTVRSVESRRWR